MVRFDCVPLYKSEWFISGDDVQLQEKLLCKEGISMTPDAEFLEQFAGVLGCMWPSLAASLCLSGGEIEEVRKEGGSQQVQALRFLKLWAAKQGATYGQLCQILKTNSLYYHQ